MAIHFSLKKSGNFSCAAAREGAPAYLSELSSKAVQTLERTKLQRVIDDLQDEIALQMCAIGEMVYATHQGTPSNSDEMQKILEYVDDLHDEIAGHEQQLKALSGIIPCPMCGEDVRKDDVYCSSCGQPLPVPDAKQS